MKSLSSYQREYEVLMRLSEPQRSLGLAKLMSEMERVFKIPALRSAGWEQDNRAVIALYRKISLSRAMTE